MVQPANWGVPQTGPQTPNTMASRMQGSLDGVLSENSAAGAPAYKLLGTRWADISVSGQLSAKQWDGGAWRTIYSIDTATGLISYASPIITTPTLTLKDGSTPVAARDLRADVSLLSMFMGDGAQTIRFFGNAAGAPDCVLEDQKSSGSAGGSSPSASFATRALNTRVRDPLNLVALSANVFTPSVAMWCEFEAPAVYANSHKTRIYNVTDGVAVGYGETAYCSTTTNGAVMTFSRGGAPLTAGKQYRLEHYTSSAFSTSGFGVAAAIGVTEIYSRVAMWRI